MKLGHLSRCMFALPPAWWARITSGLTYALVTLGIIGMLGCSEGEQKAFLMSHDSISPGMTLGEAFGAGLADYLKIMGTKNVAGSTLAEKQPASIKCARIVLDVSFFSAFPFSIDGRFYVRTYCGMNSPSSLQIVPEKTFQNAESLARALDTEYASWVGSMEFRVESPPQETWGIYNHYRLVTDQYGRITEVSPIIYAKEKSGNDNPL